MDNTTRAEPKARMNKKKPIIIGTVVFVLVLAIAGAIFGLNSISTLTKERDGLKSEVNDLQKATSRQESQSKELTKNLNEANNELKKLYAEKEEAESAVLSVSVTDATRDSRGYVHQTNTGIHDIIVDLIVKNESSAPLYLSLEGLKLKDSKDQTHTPLNSSCWPPAANKVFLKAQLVAPGESINGSICYGKLPVSVTGLKLQYGEEVFDIKPQDATYPTWQ